MRNYLDCHPWNAKHVGLRLPIVTLAQPRPISQSMSTFVYNFIETMVLEYLSRLLPPSRCPRAFQVFGSQIRGADNIGRWARYERSQDLERIWARLRAHIVYLCVYLKPVCSESS